MKDLFTNDLLWKTLLVGFFTQIIKSMIYSFKYKKWNWRWLTETGGMPSSHTASTIFLSTIVGVREGFNSSLFAVTAFFTFIVMYDAAGLRRAAGKQARVLNKIIEEFSSSGKIKEERLMELLGHTPFEVVVGALIGIIFALIFT
ncbi:MAG: divergent PAP2 family protein [Candidatus Hydrothermales bacterium]